MSDMGFDSRKSRDYEHGAVADERYREPSQVVPGWGRGSRSIFTNGTSTHSLAAAVGCTDFIPQSKSDAKMQAEIDTLKRTLNELTLRISLP